MALSFVSYLMHAKNQVNSKNNYFTITMKGLT
jgi:hypothetical protein